MKKVTVRASSVWLMGLIVGLVLLSLSAPKSAHAAAFTCLWTGNGDGSHFSSAANWTNCNGAAPVNGSNLAFDTSGMNDYVVVTNDLSGLSINKITFQGTDNDGFGYSLYGNAISLSGGITDATAGGASIDLGLNLTADQTFTSTVDYSSLFLGNEVTSTLNSGSHTLSIVTTSDTADVYMFDTLLGSGMLNFTAPGFGNSADMEGDASGYTGTFNFITGQTVFNAPDNLSPVANVVNAGSDLIFMGMDGQTVAAPISLAGGGTDPLENNWGASLIDFSGAGQITGDVTLTHLTLTSDTQIWVDDNTSVTVTGLTTNGHSLLNSPMSPGSLIGGETGTNSNAQVTTVPSSFNDTTNNAQVSNNQVLVNNGTVGDTTVNSGGVLKGDGTVSDLSVNPSGTVAPGHSPGCITVSSDLHEAGTYQAELGGTTACTGYDQIVVGGNVILNNGGSPPVAGVLQLSLYHNFQPTVGQSFEIIKNNSGSSVSGTFLNLPEGSKFTAAGYTFSITYRGGDGNDVVVSVVSVPAAGTVSPSAPDTGFGISRPSAVLVVTGVISVALGILAIWKLTSSKTKFVLYR